MANVITAPVLEEQATTTTAGKVAIVEDPNGSPRPTSPKAFEEGKKIGQRRFGQPLDVIAKKVTGVVKWFNVKSGFGFIHRHDVEEDVFVHQTAIIKNNPLKWRRSLGDGEEVEFDVAVGEKGNEAVNVTGPNGEHVKGSPYLPERQGRFFSSGRPRQNRTERNSKATSIEGGDTQSQGKEFEKVEKEGQSHDGSASDGGGVERGRGGPRFRGRGRGYSRRFYRPRSASGPQSGDSEQGRPSRDSATVKEDGNKENEANRQERRVRRRPASRFRRSQRERGEERGRGGSGGDGD